MTKFYIAYGSNQNIDQMIKRCPTAKLLGNAKLNGYQLLFRGINNSAVATVEKLKKSSVPVVIWKLEELDEKALDRYEGFPNFYHKEYVKIRFNGKWILMMMYVMNKGFPLGTPNRRYYNTILEGYKTAGFDTAILDNAVRVSEEKEL